MLFSKADAKVMPLHQTTKSFWEKIANLSESFRLFDKIQPTDCNTHYIFTHAREAMFQRNKRCILITTRLAVTKNKLSAPLQRKDIPVVITICGCLNFPDYPRFFHIREISKWRAWNLIMSFLLKDNSCQDHIKWITLIFGIQFTILF